MPSRTLKIAVIVIATAIGGLSAPYLRRIISKDTMDYLSAISFLVIGIFFVVRYGNDRRVETWRHGSKLVPIGILLVLLGMFMLIMKVFIMN